MAAVEADLRSRSEGTVEQKFQAALSVIKSLPKNGSYKPSPQMMLKFYSFYKQATEGPCKKAKPWAWDVINKAKWDAWSKLGDMSRSRAMEEYVENLKLIVEAMPATDNVQDFIRILGDFYEIVEIEPPEQFKKFSKPITSTPNKDGGPELSNGHTPGPHGDSSDSDSDTNDGERVNGHVNGHLIDDDGEDNNDSDEDAEEFQDTAEDVQTFGESPMHSYTIVNEDGQEGNSSNSNSVSTMDSTMDGSSNQDASHLTSSTVKVRQRGGEHGTRGSDRTSSMQGPGSNQGSGSENTRTNRDMHHTRGGPDSSGAAGGGSGRPPYSYSEVQDQIATTLLQLQQDMNSVLNRLSILEALTVGQQARRGRTISGDSAASSYGSRHRSKDAVPTWWPFKELSPKTLFFIIAWPFIARWLMRIWDKKRHAR